MSQFGSGELQQSQRHHSRIRSGRHVSDGTAGVTLRSVRRPVGRGWGGEVNVEKKSTESNKTIKKKSKCSLAGMQDGSSILPV